MGHSKRFFYANFQMVSIAIIYTVYMNDEQLLKYLQESQNFGFLSPKELDEQILHSIELYNMLPTHEGKLLDMGAGGGLPSFVFMSQENDIKYTLLDAMKKRTDFLEGISSELGKDSYKVINGRAEEIAKEARCSESFDIVVARGFGPPATTAECACNFLKIDGYLFVSGSPENESERWDTDGLSILGLQLERIEVGQYATGVIIKKVKPQDPKYPRRDGVPRRKPLW